MTHMSFSKPLERTGPESVREWCVSNPLFISYWRSHQNHPIDCMSYLIRRPRVSEGLHRPIKILTSSLTSWTTLDKLRNFLVICCRARGRLQEDVLSSALGMLSLLISKTLTKCSLSCRLLGAYTLLRSVSPEIVTLRSSLWMMWMPDEVLCQVSQPNLRQSHVKLISTKHPRSDLPVRKCNCGCHG